MVSEVVRLIILLTQQCKAMTHLEKYYRESLFFKSRYFEGDGYGFVRCSPECEDCGGVLVELTPLNVKDKIDMEDLITHDHRYIGHCDNGAYVSFSEANDFDVMFMWTNYLLNGPVHSWGLDDAVGVLQDFMASWCMDHEDIMTRTPDVFYENMTTIFEEIRRRERQSEYLAFSKNQIGRYRDESKDMTPEKRPRNEVPPPVKRKDKGKGRFKSKDTQVLPVGEYNVLLDDEDDTSSFEEIMRDSQKKFEKLMEEVEAPKTPQGKKISVSYSNCRGGRISTVLFEQAPVIQLGSGTGAGTGAGASSVSGAEAPPPSPMPAPKKDKGKRKRRSEADLLCCLKAFKFGRDGPKRKKRTGGKKNPIVIHSDSDSKEFKGLSKGI